MSNEVKSSYEMTEEWFEKLNPHIRGEITAEWAKKLAPDMCVETSNDSIPIYMMGVDSVPDAETPEKLMELYRKDKNSDRDSIDS